jgi:hypothetical protein
VADQQLQLVCDHVVADRFGRLKIIESMFSGFHDLSTNQGEVAARIHPAKKRVFDAIASGSKVDVKVTGDLAGDATPSFDRDIEIHVNRPGGGIAKLDYAEVAGKLAGMVRGEVTGRGFDENAEPVIRQMHDKSFRLLFCSMPPLKHRLGAAFDMDTFGAALSSKVKAKVNWDDRDVFYIKQASEDEIREILRFLMNYGKADA